MSYGHLILTRHQGEQITINLNGTQPTPMSPTLIFSGENDV